MHVLLMCALSVCGMAGLACMLEGTAAGALTGVDGVAAAGAAGG
jgi:hypothetical protein